MMATVDSGFAQLLADAAHVADKRGQPVQLVQLRNSYDFFSALGFSDEDILPMMGLTSHSLRLIKAL